MFEVSTDYKREIYSQRKGRKFEAKVRFEVVDDDAYKDVSVILPKISSLSPLANRQIINRKRKMDNKFGTFEKDYFKLDSKFKIPPTEHQIVNDNIEMGYWSEIISDEFGIFGDPLELELNFAEKHNSMGLTIYFDTLNNEYATEFYIGVYDDSTAIHEVYIKDNDKSRYTFIEHFKNYNKVIIIIKKWSEPFRRCKIAEIDFGIVYEYTDSELIKVDILQEIDSISQTIPSDEVVFTIDNSSKIFNPLNPRGFYEFLTKGQNVFVEMGLEVSPGLFEFVPMGKYYLNKWVSDEGALTSTFTARDIFDVLNDKEISESTIKQSITLYDLAEKVMLDNNIKDYKITENLRQIVTSGIYKKMSYRNFLRLIAEAGKCLIFTDNLGTVHIKEMITVNNVSFKIGISEIASLGSAEQLTNGENQPSFNFASFEKDRWKLDGSFQLSSINMESVEVGWWSNQISSDNGIFKTPLKIQFTIQKEHSSKGLQIIFDEINNEHPRSISIEAYDFHGKLKFVDNVEVESANFIYQNTQLENTNKITITIDNWNIPNRRVRIIEVGFDVPIDNISLDNMYSEPKISIKTEIKAVEVTYRDMNTNEDEVYILEREDIEDGEIYKINNPLISSNKQAKEVAEWILKEESRNAEFQINWRQNPALMLWDKVNVENGYGTLNSSNIIRQEFEYSGYLYGKTKTKGLI